MEHYLEEIIKTGNKTLENFLLLLKEDIILFKDREERKKNKFSALRAENLSNKFKKWINKSSINEDIFLSNEEYLEIRDLNESYAEYSKSQFLASNAHFVYLFALFDKFILDIAKLSLKNQSEILKKYKDHCRSEYKRSQDQNLFERLTEENELIDYFSHFSSPFKVFTKILDIDFRQEEFIEDYFNYIEMRERRNLIVHKGGIYDEVYFRTIKRYLSKSKFPQKKLNSFLNKVKENKDKNFNVDQVYFTNAIRTLYFWVCLLVSSLISRVNSENEEIILFTHPFNELLNFTLETYYGLPLITTPCQLFELYEAKYLNNDLSKMTDIDKVNWILCNEKYKETILIGYDESEDLDEQEKKEGEILKENFFKAYNQKNKILLNKIEDQLIKKIITAFLEKNFEIYTENIFLFAKRERFLLEDIESSWYMHKKLSEEIEFREIYSSYKKENNFISENIILKMTDVNNQENQ